MHSLLLVSWVEFSPKSKCNRLLTFWYCHWLTQPWFPVMMDLLVNHPRLVKPNPNNLLIKGNPLLLHPLHTKLSLLVTLLSSQPLETLAYCKALPNSSPMPGERVPRGNMTPLYDDGELIVGNGKLIPLLPPAAVVNFLTSLFQMGLGCGGVNSARRAL